MDNLGKYGYPGIHLLCPVLAWSAACWHPTWPIGLYSRKEVTMTSSVIVLLLFALGGVAGMCHFIPQHWLSSNLPMTILSVLIFQVGISIGSNKNLKEMIRGREPEDAVSPPLDHRGDTGLLRARQPADFAMGHG